MLKDKVKELCKNHNTTIMKLESDLNLGSGTVAKWDKATPKVDTILKVADYFEVSVDYLIGRTDDPTPKAPRLDDPNTPLDLSPEEMALKEQEARIKKKLEDLYESMSEEDKKTAIAILEAIAAKGK